MPSLVGGFTELGPRPGQAFRAWASCRPIHREVVSRPPWTPPRHARRNLLLLDVLREAVQVALDLRIVEPQRRARLLDEALGLPLDREVDAGAIGRDRSEVDAAAVMDLGTGAAPRDVVVGPWSEMSASNSRFTPAIDTTQCVVVSSTSRTDSTPLMAGERLELRPLVVRDADRNVDLGVRGDGRAHVEPPFRSAPGCARSATVGTLAPTGRGGCRPGRRWYDGGSETHVRGCAMGERMTDAERWWPHLSIEASTRSPDPAAPLGARAWRSRIGSRGGARTTGCRRRRVHRDADRGGRLSDRLSGPAARSDDARQARHPAVVTRPRTARPRSAGRTAGRPRRSWRAASARSTGGSAWAGGFR